ncbi:MAG: CvpA family protein [Rickettsiales bacterium]|jgi:membrane protein required for colicin V production|nr:CvpA family protein [Rickettsiales bacterium]
MPMTFLDIIFLAVVIISAVMAYGKGFISEAFGLVSWVCAAIIAKFAYPAVAARLTEWSGISGTVCTISAYVSVFVASVLLLSLFNRRFSDALAGTVFDEADRSLGVLFGAVRGVIVMAFVYIGFLWFMPNEAERPAWILSAKSQPLLRYASVFITKLLPGDGSFGGIGEVVSSNIPDSEVEAFEKLVKPDVGPAEAPKKADENFGYRPSEMKDLEREIKQIDLIAPEPESER